MLQRRVATLTPPLNAVRADFESLSLSMTLPVTPTVYTISIRAKAQSTPRSQETVGVQQCAQRKGRPHVGYRNKHGITNIIPGRFDNLDVSWDTKTSEHTSPRFRQPVFLFTPDMKKTKNHFHICLTTEQATTLHKWLKAYLDHVASDRTPEGKVNDTMKFRTEPGNCR
jgi:hypothetical protein